MPENNRTIFHMDMDAFFASVEQLDFPEYRGKPVIVGADPQQGRGRGVVSAASYEAREYRVHSALPISQAYRRCPHGVFVKPRMERYAEMSRKIMAIMYDLSPAIEPLSIDEAFLDVTGSLRLLGEAVPLAKKLKERVKSETGLVASVGVAPNKFLAKIASDLEKPDGLVIVEPGHEAEFLAPLPIKRMWGIGKKTIPLFEKHGITTIGQIADALPNELVKWLGKNGMGFWQLAHGIDSRSVETGSAVKSVSKEFTFAEDTADCELLEKMIFELAEDVGRSLRKKNLQVRTVQLKIRLSDFSTFTRRKTFSSFFDSATMIRETALQLLRQFDCMEQKTRLIGVGVSQFKTIAGEQMSLFEESGPAKNPADDLIELIENRFGRGKLRKATLMSPKNYFFPATSSDD